MYVVENLDRIVAAGSPSSDAAFSWTYYHFASTGLCAVSSFCILILIVIFCNSSKATADAHAKNTSINRRSSKTSTSKGCEASRSISKKSHTRKEPKSAAVGSNLDSFVLMDIPEMVAPTTTVEKKSQQQRQTQNRASSNNNKSYNRSVRKTRDIICVHEVEMPAPASVMLSLTDDQLPLAKTAAKILGPGGVEMRSIDSTPTTNSTKTPRDII